MASFVTKVLVAAGDLEKVNLHEKIADMKKEIITLMNDVKDFMDDNYIRFTPELKDDQMLVVKAEKLIDEMNNLQNRISEQIKVDLSGSIEELNTLSQELKETNLSLRLSKQLLTLNEYINSIKEYRKRKCYTEVAKTLKLMQVLLDDPETELPDMDIYTGIQTEYVNMYSLFLTEAAHLWSEQICWETDDNDKTVTSLSIGDQFEKLQDLVKGLHEIDNLMTYIHKFSTTLMKYIISPIIHDNCAIQIVKQKSFKIQITKKKKIPNYNSVLHNLTLLFKFLHQHFNIVIHDDQTFLMKLQLILLDPLAEFLISDCISHTIPKTSAELEQFDTIREQCCAFQDYLVEIGFITNNQLFLSEYTKDIEKLFTEKICQDFLVEAREIMKKDLHNSVTYNPEELCTLSILNDHTLHLDGKLSETTFHLPKCQISKSVQEILDLAKSILNEACRSSETRAIRLYDTCRGVFEMYAVLVVECHRTLLETIPTEVALFHNNCMYLAHHLLTLAHEYRDKLPEALQKLNLTFVDQTLLLRKVGVEHFLAHMRYQRNIAAEILKESGLSTLGQCSKLHPGTERALRQCIRQLELLKAAWLDILPITNYCKAIGCITDSIIEELITRVMSVEDIPANVATELSETFEIVANRVPLIFPDASIIQQYVRRWNQFMKLIKVLVASLKEIEIDWGNGKGPLSNVFTASQIKQLIRALFQNTERRSALLASIK